MDLFKAKEYLEPLIVQYYIDYTGIFPSSSRSEEKGHLGMNRRWGTMVSIYSLIFARSLVEIISSKYAGGDCLSFSKHTRDPGRDDTPRLRP